MKGWLIALLLMATPAAAQLSTPDQPLADVQQEKVAKALMAELRCITCQNQNILDSTAPQAETMRAEVRQQIAAGRKPEEVRSYFIERYGDWVSFVPPAREDTVLLWGAPLLLLAIGLALVWRRFQR